MFKVTITNEQCPQSPWSASFSTEIEAQNWLNSQIGKPWRLPERQVPTYDENGEPILDENGEPVMETLPAEFTSEIVDITEEYNLAKQKQEAQSYLNSTDWYITRFVERGVAVPQEITQARLAAVATLNL